MGKIRDYILSRTQQPKAPAAQQQQSVERNAVRPQTLKAMHAEQAAADKAAEKPITSKVTEQIVDIRETLQRAKAGLENPVPQTTSAPTEGGSIGALRQNQTGQEKPQAALSPTDGVKGQTVTQDRGRSR